jgi:hypothetical protein
LRSDRFHIFCDPAMLRPERRQCWLRAQAPRNQQSSSLSNGERRERSMSDIHLSLTVAAFPCILGAAGVPLTRCGL